MIVIDDYEMEILNKLFSKQVIGKHDLYEENILRGFPRHDYKKYSNAIKSLAKKNLIVARPKPHGIKYGLNPRKIEEIVAFIEKY
jgi:hypothetical protein